MKSKALISAIFVFIFFSGLAQTPDMNLVPYRQGNLWGYAHPDKSIAIKPAYDEAKWFIAGYAVVKKGNLYGYINSAGKLVIPYKFYNAKSFHYGYFDNTGKHTEGGRMVANKDTVLFAGAVVKPGGNEVCINTKGETMSRCPAINEETVPDNMANMVTQKKEYGLVNNSVLFDNLVDDYKIPGDDHTYYVGKKGNMFGVVNNTFDVIVPFEYSAFTKLDVDAKIYLLVVKDGKYGVLNGSGTEFIPVTSANIRAVKTSKGQTLLVVTNDGFTGLRDFSNNSLLQSKYSGIMYDALGGFVLTGADNTKGFYFLNGTTVEPKYSAVELLKNVPFLKVTTTGGKDGYVNDKGDEFFSE